MKSAIAGISFAALACTATVANAQTDIGAQAARPKGYAAASFGSPLAFGAGWGNVGVGAFVFAPDDEDIRDGALGLAFGLGDPNKYVGLETAVSFSSLLESEGSDESFGESGSVALKLHTNLPGGAAFAVGVTGTGRWGDAADQSSSSVYAVGTKVFSVANHPLVLNLGLGDGLYNDADESGANVLGSASFYFTRQFSAILDYTGRFVNVAVSAAPFANYPFTATLGVVNVAEKDDADPEIALSLGYAFGF